MKVLIETERLIFREIMLSDREAMFELDADPQVHQYLGKKPVKDLEQVDVLIKFIRKQYNDNGIGRWAIIEKSSGDFIGWGGFKFVTGWVNSRTRYHDLGYRLIQRYWGKGYATELAKAAVDYGFTTLNLKVIYAFADTENKASRHALEKAGLHFVENFEYEEEEHDWFEITKTDYLSTSK